MLANEGERFKAAAACRASDHGGLGRQVRPGALAVLALVLLAAGCSHERETDSVRKFFARGRIGHAPDAAIIKRGDPTNPVLVVYGFYDSDVDECRVIASSMNAQHAVECEEVGGTRCTDPPYSCVLFNH